MTVKRNNKTGKWSVDFYSRNNRIRKGDFNRRIDAENYKAKILNDKMYKKYLLPKEEMVNFLAMAKQYLSNHSQPNKRSFKTDLALMKPLVEFFGGTLINDITRADIDLYRTERIKTRVRQGNKYPEGLPISPTTVNRELMLLRSIFSKAIEWGLLFNNPALKLKMAKENPKERILTEKEIIKFIGAAREPLKSIILIALNTGMRVGEILKLKWDQVNLGEKFLSITAFVSKNRRIRQIPLNESMTNLFWKLTQERNGRDYVFINPATGKPLTTIKTAWGFLLKRSGITDLRFHDLRHIFATYSILNGGDLIHLKETLGHTDIRTTARYSKAMMEGQRKLVNGFEVSGDIGEVIELKKKSS